MLTDVCRFSLCNTVTTKRAEHIFLKVCLVAALELSGTSHDQHQQMCTCYGIVEVEFPSCWSILKDSHLEVESPYIIKVLVLEYINFMLLVLHYLYLVVVVSYFSFM